MDIRVHHRSGLYCSYCKREMIHFTASAPTRDHVMPRSKGGRKTVPCCLKCNQLKANMLPHEWERFMEANPRWWDAPGLETAFKKARRRTAKPCSVVPQVYDDPKMQAGFEHAYKGRVHLLSEVDDFDVNGQSQKQGE